MDISMKSSPMDPRTDLQILEDFGRFRRSLNLHFGNGLRALGLGTKQASLLWHLSRRSKASPADLSRDTLTDPAAMTKLVNLLIRESLLRHEKHPTDKRRWELSLTPQGQRLAVKVETLYARLSEEALKSLNTSEKSDFSRTLQKLSGHLAREKNTPRFPNHKKNKE